jgi:uncharacterized membrane protein SpoIIM required for sporulation/ABC-type transport system involved in multi-copper enzyme maturation permease subunit
MSTMAASVRNGWASFGRAWIVTRREVRDTMRDWRLMIPIGLLTLVFPLLMQVLADVAQRWALRWGGAIIGDRIIPFLLMIVGFFPISFSLVIALETFVGEKERYSLEPLLATPLTNTELYWGKTLAAMIPPVCASYMGLVVYLVGLYFVLDWVPSIELLCLIVLLTTAEALVMVSGAVVISSQTTSVRAANILASFVIIPMALLVQGESVIMFWADYQPLWWIFAALVAADMLLVRMGIRLFNREELLGRDIDTVNIRRAWRYFVGYLWRPPEAAAGFKPELPRPAADRARLGDILKPLKDLLSRAGWARVAAGLWDGVLWVGRVYRHDIPVILKRNLKSVGVVALTQVGAFVVGLYFARMFPLPKGLVTLEVPEDAFENIPDVGFLPDFSVLTIMFHNLRVMVLEGMLGLFSFGTLAVVILMVPMAIIGLFAGQAPMMGASPLLLLGTFILPHGIVELPAAIIGTAMALRLGAVVISPPEGMTVSQGILHALADMVKVLVLLVVPLLLIAAMLEVWLTPWIIVQVW